MRVDPPGDGDAAFEALWREHRPFLVDLAFRMLGNIGDAEDVVQDAFMRLLRADVDAIEDPRGWLVVVVSRRCLDVLRSARVRRDARPAAADAAVLSTEPAAQTADPAAQTADPADRVTLDDNVRMALLVVLEQLTPAERTAFVLHDVFRYPFTEISAILGRPVEACRKLASRGRHRMEAAGGPARFAVEPADHRLVAERFIQACAGGDLGALLELLDADVAGEVDVGFGGAPVAVQAGRDRVARNLLRFFDGATGVTLVSQSMNGWPGVLAFKDGHLYALVTLETRDGLISDIHAVRNPLTLAAVGDLVEARR